jgi:hypothetical protein
MEEQKQVQIQPSKEALEKAKNAHEYSMNLLNQMMQQMWQIGYTSGYQDAMEIMKTDQSGEAGLQ